MVEYRNIWFRVIITFIATIYILLHGHHLDVIARAFTDPSFYLAVATSYPMTLFFVYLIHWVTKKLDSLHDWRTSTVERIVWQFLFAVVLPSLLDLGAMALYSAIVGIHFDAEVFLAVDFPIIVSFIILMNMYYVIYFLLKSESKITTEDDNSNDPPILKIDYDGTFVQLSPTDILYFYRSGNFIKIVTHNKEYSTKDLLSLNQLEADYAYHGFLRINRGVIINMSNVQGYGPGSGNRKFVIFRDSITITDNQTDLFDVTGKYMTPFKQYIHSNLA